MSTQTKGRLFLIPNVLGDTAPLEVMPISVKKTMEALRCFVFEKEKAGRAFVNSICPNIPQDNISVHLLNKFTNEEDLTGMLLPLQNGEDVGLITSGFIFFFGIGDRGFVTYILVVCFWQIVVGFVQHSHDLNQFEYTIYSIPLKKNYKFHKRQEASACLTSIFLPFPTLAPAFLPAFIKAVFVGL